MEQPSIMTWSRSTFLPVLFATLTALSLCAGALAENHIQISDTPEGIADKLDELQEKFDETKDTCYKDEINEIWDSLDDDPRDEVLEIWEARDEAQNREDERFNRELEDLRGDEWAAYTAAFLSSTLFDVDTPFRQALGENLQVLGQQTDQTVQELVGQMNEQSRAEAAEAKRVKLEAIGDDILAGYDQILVDDKLPTPLVTVRGFEGYPHSNVVTRSARMVQDAFIGNNLKLRYRLNTLKTATGDIPEGNFATQPGYEVFNNVTGNLRMIGYLEANYSGAMTSAIDGKTEALSDFLSLPGMEDTPEHSLRREIFIESLTHLSMDVELRYARFERTYQELQTMKRDRRRWESRTPLPTTKEERVAYNAYLNFMNDSIAYQESELASLTLEQTERDYLLALNRSPFLTAPIEVDGFEGPMWQYLIGWMRGALGGYQATWNTSYRTPEKDQEALDQAIDYLDGLTMDAAFEYGTIIMGPDLIRTFGGPSFTPLRKQLTEQLGPMIPNIGIFVGELESLFEREWGDTEYSRMFFDVGMGIAGLVVAGGIVIFPVAAPLLVPVELTLMGTQLTFEGGRLVGAYQDYSAAETLVQSGMGDRAALTRYGDVLEAQVGTFVLTAGLTVVGVAGSISALDDAARALNQADNVAPAVGATGRAADDLARGSDTATASLDETQRFRPGTFDPEPPGTVIDADTFRGMTLDQQAAHLGGLSESAQVKLANQLSLADREALGTAMVYQRILRGIRENPGAVRYRPAGGGFSRLTPEPAAQLTDAEILDAVRTGGIIIDPGAYRALGTLADDPITGPFSLLRGADETIEEMDLPVRGYFVSEMTPTQIDELFRIDIDSLPIGQRQTILLQRADALRQNMIPSFPVDPATQRALGVITVRNIQRVKERALSPEELGGVGWLDEWGAPPVYTRPAPNVAAGAGAMDSGSTVIGGTDSGSTVIGGIDETQIFRPGTFDPEPPGNVVDAGGLPDWMYVPPPRPARIVPRGGWPSHLDGLQDNIYFPDFFRRPPVKARAGTSGVGNSSRAMEQGSSIIHLKPGPRTLPVGKGAPWRNFMIRSFMIGGCQGDWTPDCNDDTPIAVLSIPAGKEKGVAACLAQDPQVAMVEPNSGRWRQRTVDDPLFKSQGSWQQDYADQWALHHVGLTGDGDDWPARNADGDTIVVAVIDTGLAWSHPDFDLGSLWINGKEIPGNDIDDDLNGYVDDVAGWNFLDYAPVPWDFDGHGTLVAGIIAAQTGNGVGVAGINSNVRIMPLKAINNAGQSRAAYLAEAIVYAANNGAKIINLSVGGAHLTVAEQLAIDYATSQGVLVIAAAGNEGQRLDDYGPAGAKGVLTVAASDAQDRRMEFSNWGPQVDLIAPGEDIVGLRAPATDLMRTTDAEDYKRGANFVGDDQLYYRATGTSFSAPIVAGVASLVWGNDPSLTATDVRRILQQSAQDVGPPGRDKLFGYGLLDAQAALSADPAFFIDVQISGVAPVQDAGKVYLEILGSLDGDQLKSGWLEYGAGTEPDEWKRLKGELKKPVYEASLGRIPATELGGEPTWTVRLIGEHANGQRREHRFQIDLN